MSDSQLISAGPNGVGGKLLRILMIEVSEEDAELERRQLVKAGYETTMLRVTGADEMRKALANHQWDVIIADYSVPGFGALPALELLKQSGRDIPLIILSGTISDEMAVVAMRAGAHDYILKNNLSRLVPAIERGLQETAIRSRNRQMEAMLHLQAAALDSAANTIIITDRNGTIQWVNAAFTRLTGYTPAEAIGRNPRVLKSGKHDNRVYKSMWDTISSGEVWRGEIVNRRKDGTLYFEEMTITPVRSAEGVITHFVAVKEDISERKQAQETQARLAAIVEYSSDAIISKSLDGIITSWNQSAERFFGYTSAEAIGQPITLIIPPDRYEEELAVRHCLRRGELIGHHETTRMAKDGRIIDVSLTTSPIRNSDGAVIGISSSVRDITERKQTVQALRASEERWAITLQSIGDAVISTDAYGHVEFMNEIAQKLTGWTLTEAKGLDLGKVFDIVQEVTRVKPESPVAKVIRLGKVVGLANHTMLVSRNGSELPIEDSAAPIRDRKGEIEGVVLVFHDASEQRKVERALRNNERLATTGRLAATIAHEIHNPLDAVGNLLYLAAHNAQESGTKELISEATKELGRVTQMTQQMLSFQREASKPVPVNIPEVLESVVALYERKIEAAGITLKKQFDVNGTILALPGELRQVFANLLGNAIEAVGTRKGTIALLASQGHNWETGQAGLRIVVADSGPGIPSGIREKIFEPFFTTKGEAGTGLGLWITSDIVRKYQGTIRIRTSTHGSRSGTHFSIFFPFEIKSDLSQPA